MAQAPRAGRLGPERGGTGADGTRIVLAGNDMAELGAGDVFVTETPGGGGCGAPG
ncbi:hypothetical protein [Jannaschia seohaensis]|uniref:Hydantoinase B/oxoprolinase domain-containing protein n=1 Tax=Jannaschia seohaensis TaxID=475081 RepID=A0A2Y9C3Z9_9RHOB|nr:hypothetical protein [Jannaschia seohaensis]PWJ22435.1 hypothetical protein BCF38_101849 [Jannaschia seohaensis]SSA38713.1 hypothetical protein SAMN05421539_101849 [Jannaschia seohaensis]